MEYPYIKTSPDPEDPTKVIQEVTKLIIDARVVAFSEDPEVNNPTDDVDAYFYGLTIDNGREQIQTCQPGEDGYQPMTQAEAHKYLQDDINQTLDNYGIKYAK